MHVDELMNNVDNKIWPSNMFDINMWNKIVEMANNITLHIFFLNRLFIFNKN